MTCYFAIPILELLYTPKKMFLLAFSFANFETTRGSRGKATLPKKSYSSIFKNIFGPRYVGEYAKYVLWVNDIATMYSKFVK